MRDRPLCGHQDCLGVFCQSRLSLEHQCVAAALAAPAENAFVQQQNHVHDSCECAGICMTVTELLTIEMPPKVHKCRVREQGEKLRWHLSTRQSPGQVLSCGIMLLIASMSSFGFNACRFVQEALCLTLLWMKGLLPES